MLPDRIEREVLIAAPVERVWSLVTEAEHVGRWFGDAGAEIDLRPGGAMTMTWSEYGTAHGRVEAVERPHRFAYRWVSGAGDFGAVPTDDNSTLVEFTLREDGDGTLLKVVETGFAQLPVSEEKRIEAHEGNTRGWKMELEDLIAYERQQSAVR